MADRDKKYNLSKRATVFGGKLDFWQPIAEAWSPTQPEGTVFLNVAENSLMQNEVAAHIKNNFEVDPKEHLTYSVGPRGSLRLRNALSKLFNDHFRSVKPVHAEEFLITAGVRAATDHLTWSICDEGDGILIPQPLYSGFPIDVTTRSGGKIVPVSFARDNGSLDLEDVFSPEANEACLKRAYNQSKQQGIEPRAVMITNPHNPLGRCYPGETIRAIAIFCADHGLHLISDEIYALSIFETNDNPRSDKFQSVLSLDFDGIIDPHALHVSYGASKDFGACGLRLGVLHTRNPAVQSTVASLSTFSWGAYVVQDMWARMLEDESFLNEFITENQRRLTSHYKILTRFLDYHRIPYLKGGNAGIFVWVDLRRVFLGDDAAGDFQALRSSSPDFAKYQARLDRLSKIWKTRGVLLSGGSAFLPEEIGWFRVVFSMEKAALETGLQRLLDGIHELRSTEQI